MLSASHGGVLSPVLLSLTLTLAAGFATAAAAQGSSEDIVPAYVSIVAGNVTLDRDGQIENAVENMALLAGDRLSAARGRFEIRLGRDVVVSVDESSDMRLVDTAFVALDAGALHLNVRGNVEFRVDAAGRSMVTTKGEFRVRLVDNGRVPELRVTALSGSVEVLSATERTILRAGYQLALPAVGAPGRPYAVSVSRLDAFDRWVEANRRDRMASSSSSYLPSDLRDYDTELSLSGHWGYLAPYGYVWYPRVGVGWRPYSDGQWTFAGTFGWTWAAGPRWGWPTHHYGRWGWRNAKWYWIPGTQWAAAWVSWGSSPGYVGWCPLGFDNRPAVAITSAGVWNAWTTAPSRAFTRSVVGRLGARPVHANWPHTATVRNAGPARPVGIGGSTSALATPRRPRPSSETVAAPAARVPASSRVASSASAPRAVSASSAGASAAYFGSAARPPASRRNERQDVRAVAATERPSGSRTSKASSRSVDAAAARGVSVAQMGGAQRLASRAPISESSMVRGSSRARRATPAPSAAANSPSADRSTTTRAVKSVPARSHSVTASGLSPTLTPAPSPVFMRGVAPR